MKKFFAMAVALIASVSMFAQSNVGSFYLVPKAGVNLAYMTKSENTSSRIGPAAGVEAGYQMTEEFSLSAALMYSMQGVKGKEDGIDGSINNDYLNIPILANYYLAPGLQVKLGVQPGFLLSSKLKGEEEVTGAEYDSKELFESFDFSIPVGISYEFSNIVLDARYNWGLTKTISEASAENTKNSVFQITLGYKLPL